VTVLAIIGQVVLSVLAIFGLILLFRGVFDRFFASPAITVAVTVKSRKDADDLDILLCEAERSLFRRRGIPAVVLISPELCCGEVVENGELLPEYQEKIRIHGAVAYMGTPLKNLTDMDF